MQIKQILNNVCEFHGHLSAYYHQLSDDMDQSRIKLILDLLSQHEAGLRESLEAYEEDASKEVMDSWIECPSCQEIRQRLGQLLSAGTESNLESVVERALALDRCLFDFYREGEAHAPNPRVQRVFRSLAALQQGEVRELALSATQICDA